MPATDGAACPIAATMAVIGRPWAVLVLRDLFNGLRRFDQLATHLGIARNVLTRRLAELVEHGLVQRVEYRELGQRARYEYRLTGAGRDLRPVLLAMMIYGDRHLADQDRPPMQLLHRDCGGPVTVRLECANGHELGPSARLVVDPARPTTGH